MIDWKQFYANGGYYGENDPYCYDDGLDEEDQENQENEQNEEENEEYD